MQQINTSNTFEIEWHQLELRYQSLRINTPSAVRQLMTSLHIYGLLTPIIVTASGIHDRPWVVIDGYLRIAALKALNRDDITATAWQIDPHEALLNVYTHNKSRPWDVFEEGNLIQELMTQHQYSKATIATSLGKSESWICRRLQLITQLPCFVKEAIHQGTVSSWTANRVLIPLARANTEHAELLINYLTSKSHTSRELLSFYEHYMRSNKKIRSDLAENPTLFFKLHAQEKLESSNQHTELAPESTWERKCNQICECLNVITSIMPAVFYPGQTAYEQQDLQGKFHSVYTQIDHIHQKMEETIHARTTNSTPCQTVIERR